MSMDKDGYWVDDLPTAYDLMLSLGRGFKVTRDSFVASMTKAGVTADDAGLLWEAIHENAHDADEEFGGFVNGIMTVVGLLKKR